MNFAFKREPAAWVGFVQTVLAALTGLGIVSLTSAQQGLIMAVVTAAGALIIRANVYAPVDKSGQPITPVTQDQFSTIAAQMNAPATPPPPEIIHTVSEMPQRHISAEEAMKEIDEYAASLKKP